MNTKTRETLSKVPEVTLVFLVIKILATTLGETGGDGQKKPDSANGGSPQPSFGVATKRGCQTAGKLPGNNEKSALK